MTALDVTTLHVVVVDPFRCDSVQMSHAEKNELDQALMLD